MAINSTGRRVLVNKGIYDSTLQYYPMDAVYYEGSYYICIKECVGVEPTDTNYWGYSHSIGDIGVSLGIRLSDGILYITDTVTTEDLGKVSILYRGEYSSTATYASLDVVTYEGSSYICIKDTTGNLPTDPTYFGLLCEGTEGRGITSVNLVDNKHLVVNYTDGTSTDLGEIIIKTPLDQIDAASINSEGHLILSKDDGTTLDAGYVVGPAGPTGPRGKKGEDAPREAVLFVTQTLTTEQQTQARTNIGAASDEETTRLSEEIADIKENGTGGNDERLDKIASFFDLTEPIQSDNRLNPAEIVAGYYLTNKGVIGQNNSYSYTGFIPVSSGEILQMFVNLGEVASYREIKNARWIAAYDANKTLLPDLGVENSHAYTVPEGVSYVRYCYTSYNVNTDQAITSLEAIVATDGSDTIVPYEPYGMIGEEPHLKAEAYTLIKNGFRVAVNGSWTAEEENHDIAEYMMRYMAQLPNGLNGSISIGKGYHVSGGGYVVVDATNLSYFTGANENASLTYPHNLTLKDYLAITVELDKSANAKITVTTNGGSYTNDKMSLAAIRRGAFFVTDSASEGVNGHFSYAAKGWGYNTHVYGDSYIGVHSDQRWPYYAVQDGYNVYFNGFSGRNSADALPVLKSVLKQGARPERILWCLGMNDSDNGAPNASWLACVEELKTICADNAIELILSTIPLVTAVDNTYKNAYVRGSGYRYIDFAKAVGAAEDTTWYDNMLADDGVHPVTEGAVALYQQVLTDVPEIIMD